MLDAVAVEEVNRPDLRALGCDDIHMFGNQVVVIRTGEACVGVSIIFGQRGLTLGIGVTMV